MTLAMTLASWISVIFALVGALALLLQALSKRAIYRSAADSVAVEIPSALQDWDEEFKRLTGVCPWPIEVVRPGAAEVTTHRLQDYEHQPGDISYYRSSQGYIVLTDSGAQNFVVRNCRVVNS